MALSASASIQSVVSSAWAQAQQQQAQRMADEAEQRAQTLQVKAREAKDVAQRAQENARQLAVQSSQADQQAGQAEQGLVAQKSLAQVKTVFNELSSQIAKVVQAPSSDSAPAVTAQSPVINAAGQTTGTLVNVTA